MPASQSRPAQTRVFLVGCPRSGTTLLQSLLAAHPRLVSFPETHFFRVVLARREERWRRRFGIASSHAPEALARLAALGVMDGSSSNQRRRMVTVGQYARLLTNTLDRAAAASGATHWLEKTPDHLLDVREIQRHVRRPNFIHMIRDGRAVIASLFEVKREHPEWGGLATVDRVIEQWRRGLHRSLSWVGRRNHAFVSYERLVADPHRVLFRLCEFLSLPVSDGSVEEMVRGYAREQQRLVGYAQGTPKGYVAQGEPWKETVAEQIENRNAEKFTALFAPDDRALIDRAVADEERTIEAFPFL